MAQIGSIQALRAVAATSVVFDHLLTEALKMPAAASLGSAPLVLNLTGGGVDLFFVISGFIMVYASQDLFADPNGWRRFLGHRIARIVPLYWLMTTLFLVALALTPGSVNSAVPNGIEILKSYFFIPYAHAGSDLIRPIYKLGWTLDYEMFFYVVFAGFLVLPIRLAIYGMAIFFSCLVALGITLAPSPGAFAFWTDPIIFEFVMGSLIAIAFLKGWRLHPAITAMIFVIAFCSFAAANISGVSANPWWRVIVRSVPIAAIVGAAVLRKESPSSNVWIMSLLIALGDASYALYLSHPWVIRPMHLIWIRSGLSSGTSPWMFICVALVLCLALSLFIHHWFERPMTKFVQKLMTVPRPKAAAQPAYDKANHLVR